MPNRFIRAIFPILWMGLIFFLSDKPYDYFPVETTNAQQVSAHIFLYAVLSYLIIFAAIGQRKSWRLRNIFLFSLFFCVAYGISDEYHQGFVPGRFVSYSDLAFDGLGAVFGIFVYHFFMPKKPKLLLHVCCIGCGGYVADFLKKEFDVLLYFFNPNIFPEEEYIKRLEEADRVAKSLGLKLIRGRYDHKKWLEAVRGMEKEPEGGERCRVCYRYRLDESGRLAKEKKCDFLTSTLSISPHKDSQKIIEEGMATAKKFGIKFFKKDFKEDDGFKKSCQFSKKLNLYRQNYCGCEFSIRKKKA